MRPINRMYLAPPWIKASKYLIPSLYYSTKKMSCCGGSCGCVSNCKCGNGCGGCEMRPDMVGKATTIVDFGAGSHEGSSEGFEMISGSEGGSCDCTKCKCVSNCSCACCSCN